MSLGFISFYDRLCEAMQVKTDDETVLKQRLYGTYVYMLLTHPITGPLREVNSKVESLTAQALRLHTSMEGISETDYDSFVQRVDTLKKML